MKSTARVGSHPIHPMIIPYPFALLSSAAVFDVGARMNGRAAWSQTARHLTAAGLGAGLVAAVPGLVDYFGTVPPRTRARRSALIHAACNVSAIACFALATATRNTDARVSRSGLALAIAGTGLLAVAGWLGGQLVYHDRIGVVEPEPRRAMPADSDRDVLMPPRQRTVSPQTR